MIDIHDVLEQIREIRDMQRRYEATLTELVKQMAVNNHILNEHHKRSTMLEEQLKPIQDDFKFRYQITKLMFGTAGVVSIIGVIIGIFTAISKLF